jgi:F-type H+-transporting ATPase subunit epsilon
VADTFPCKIVTPTQECFDGEATYVSFPSWDGQYGMMKGLAPLLSSLAPGTLRIDTANGSSLYLIEGGFAHVDGNGLSLVTEGAIPVDELNLEEAKAELAEANARVTSGGKDQVAVERAQKIATAKVALASKS